MSVTIAKGAWEEIRYAVDFPAKSDRKKLAAAIELALEQACNQLVGKAARSHDQMIVALNKFLKKEDLASDLIDVANKALDLLEYVDAIDNLSYDEEVDNFNKFANVTLNSFISVLKYDS